MTQAARARVRWEDSDMKQRMKGASEAATERGTYAGGSSRTGIKGKARATKMLDRRSLRGGNYVSRAGDPPPNERALGKRECPPKEWKERDEMRQRDAGLKQSLLDLQPNRECVQRVNL